jgi:hypothetical protein
MGTNRDTKSFWKTITAIIGVIATILTVITTVLTLSHQLICLPAGQSWDDSQKKCIGDSKTPQFSNPPTPPIPQPPTLMASHENFTFFSKTIQYDDPPLSIIPCTYENINLRKIKLEGVCFSTTFRIPFSSVRLLATNSLHSQDQDPQLIIRQFYYINIARSEEHFSPKHLLYVKYFLYSALFPYFFEGVAIIENNIFYAMDFPDSMYQEYSKQIDTIAQSLVHDPRLSFS